MTTCLLQGQLDFMLQLRARQVLLATDGVQQLLAQHTQLLQLVDQLNHIALRQAHIALGSLRRLQRRE
jgi:hypothetical protein